MLHRAPPVGTPHTPCQSGARGPALRALRSYRRTANGDNPCVCAPCVCVCMCLFEKKAYVRLDR